MKLGLIYHQCRHKDMVLPILILLNYGKTDSILNKKSETYIT